MKFVAPLCAGTNQSQVIMNIFGNALKYTQEGSIVVKLALDPPNNNATEDTERMLNINITDTGRGISTEYLLTSLYTRK